MTEIDSIFAHARATPDRTALIFNGLTFSYRAFATRIDLARLELSSQALDRDRVAILCLNRALDAWIVGLALRDLGITTVHGRSVEDIERLGLPAVSVVRARTESWPGLDAAADRVGAPLILAPLTSDPSATDPDIALTACADAPGGHILLTSGTTGVYKKVLIDPVAAVRVRQQRSDLFGFTSDSVVNLFDFGGWTSIGYQLPTAVWDRGGAVVLHQGPERWRSLAAPGLTMAFTQPQLLAELLAVPPEVDLRNDGLALMVTAGVLSSAQWRAARERLTPDVRTCVGSTETGAFGVTSVETAADLRWHWIDPARRVEVVDDDDRPLPAGETGVVRIGTLGVESYMDDPQATREFFRDGHFYPGDLGVLRADGRLALQGRVTEVINVMGDKIAAAPIEFALQEALGAQAVCVFSVPGPEGEAVHVAVQPGGPVSPAALKAALLAALPGIARVRVHTVKDFPRNHLGKIERGTLKARLAPDDPTSSQ